MSLPSQNFKVEDIKLNKMYSDFDDNYQKSSLDIKKINQVYGQLKFPDELDDRPLLFGCFVSSIDGTIAFKDNHKSGKIARNNNENLAGGKVDLWVLNLLRAAVDGIIIGPKTLEAEENLTAHIFDKELLRARIEGLNKPPVPYNIIVSKTGQSIPYDHRIFKEEQVPVIIATSPGGEEYVVDNINCNYNLINLNSNINDRKENRLSIKENKVIILVSGEEYNLNDKLLFDFLKEAGLDKISVEAPSYAHYLIQQQLLDELFLNRSGIYIGGPKFLNSNVKSSLSTKAAPSAKTITIHNYDSYFFYFRYKLVY